MGKPPKLVAPLSKQQEKPPSLGRTQGAGPSLEVLEAQQGIACEPRHLESSALLVIELWLMRGRIPPLSMEMRHPLNKMFIDSQHS